MAQQVAANMQDTGLPLTDDNISDMAESLSYGKWQFVRRYKELSC